MKRTYRLPARVDEVETHVESLVGALGPRFDAPLVRAGVNEAILNAIIHGALGVASPADRDPIAFLDALHAAEATSPHAHVEVTTHTDDDSDLCAITVRDPGPGFDVASAERAAANSDLLAASGRGLVLMHAASESVAWNGVGNEVTLWIRARSPRTTARSSAPTPPAEALDAVIPPALNGRLSRARAALSRVMTLIPLAAARLFGPRVRRAVDVVVGVSGLAAISPVLGAAAVAIKATSRGPILFRQTRIGKGGRPFSLYKLRTMHVDAEARRAAVEALNESRGGVTFKVRRDPRITPVGRVLRKFSVDELPQLMNLVDGTMTLFGPRPPIASEVARYGHHQRRRLEVTPGLTCLWQISGRSDLSFDEQVSLDLAYIDRAQPMDELLILLKTIPAVLTGRGAY
jgi:lipopolysaccharide/colanic/teichoic acid biosynthesis glycosyltransferase